MGIHGRIPDDCGEASIRVRIPVRGVENAEMCRRGSKQVPETTGFGQSGHKSNGLCPEVWIGKNVETAIQRQGGHSATEDVR